MRIQHNIMAMNAYRNYNTNTSALSKNLEKLSSGYKINRAGDDAAGLAISEKMRAQITGLNAAQKNVKDGISLVKTAEGAMQEIQDMLNRMDYLATQSANGTYDNEVDRANLQKEVDALRSEIDRIADSANFNGIKLLDGSLDTNATGVGATAAGEDTVSTLVTSQKGTTLATNTVEHQDGVDAAKTKFGVALHEVKFSNETGSSMKITLGDYGSIEVKAGALDGKAADAGEYSAKDIVDAIKAAGNDSTGNKLAFSGKITAGDAADEIKIDGESFKLTTADDGTTLVFEQKAKTAKHIDGDMQVSVTDGAAVVTPGAAPTAGPTKATVTEDVQGKDDPSGAAATFSYNFAGVTGLSAGDYTVEIAGKSVDVTLAEGATDAADLATAVFDKLKTETFTDDAGGNYTLADDTNGKITFTASGNGASAANAISGDIKISPAAVAASSVTGDYNKKTTVTTQGRDAAAGRIASGVATLTEDHFADGNIIKVGDKELTVTTDVANKADTDYIYVGDLDVSQTADLQKAIDRLTVSAADNSVWTVGQGTVDGTVTFVEKVAADGTTYMDGDDPEYDLTKENVIKETFGVVTKGAEATTGKDGKPLTLQIGDTSDEYNQLKVKVGDMHVKAMGFNLDAQGNIVPGDGTSIKDISIASQDKAQEAIAVIRNAINYVSSIRGDLGAVQNRLEHTANNLSVMAENIQDAESTIRDTDIAEEMMAYTKNNILVQSAQAMLAQANAVPQGVLQLLG